MSKRSEDERRKNAEQLEKYGEILGDNN